MGRRNLWGRYLGTAVAAAMAGMLAVSVVDQPAYAETRYGPVQHNWRDAVVASVADPSRYPQGMNRGDCRVESGRRPVVLLNGAFLNRYATWSKFSPMLSRAGFCVFGLDYGGPADGPFHQVGDLRSSAAEIGAFIDRVRERTGAAKVDVVGYSEGGMVSLYYLNVLGGARTVNTLVTLGSPIRGMSGYGILDAISSIPETRRALARVLPAATDGAVGSSFFEEVGEHGLVRPEVRYVSIRSEADLVVQPRETMFPAAPNVTNRSVQDHCPPDRVFHGSLIYDDTALQLVRNALDPRAAEPVPCTPRPPLA